MSENEQEIIETQALALRAQEASHGAALQPIPSDRGLSLTQPDIVQMMERRVKTLDNLRKAAIKATVPSDWTLFRDKEGRVTAIPGKSACTKIGQVYGIQVLKPSPVRLFSDEAGSEPKTVAECYGDGYCALTGQYFPGLRGYRVSGESFTGRSEDQVGSQDLIQSARTALENKAVRVLSGLVKVELSELASVLGHTPESFEAAAARGSGYGSARERTSGSGSGEAISDAQRKRAYAIASTRATYLKAEGVDAKVILNTVGREMGIKGDPTRAQYDAFISKVEQFELQAEAL